MKKKKKDAVSFEKITLLEMNKLLGGVWVKAIKDGKEILVWVEA